MLNRFSTQEEKSGAQNLNIVLHTLSFRTKTERWLLA